MSKDILSQLGKKNILPKSVNSRLTKPPIRQVFPPAVKFNSHSVLIYDTLIKIQPQETTLLQPNKKIYSFDLDSTLVVTKSGKTFPVKHTDWKWCFGTVVDKLVKLSQESHPVVIFTNQGGVISDKKDSKSMYKFLMRMKSILEEFNKHGISNVWIYASTKISSAAKKKDQGLESVYRKPEIGMYKEFQKDYLNIVKHELEKTNVLYIGDAAGRKTDFSDSDLIFAQNCGIQFKIPEEFF